MKPLPNLAFYGSYSVSFLPSAGDQFRVLDPTTALSAPERFENAEIGVKYEITPALILTAALFNLDRDNQPIPSSTEAGFSAGPGKTNTRGPRSASPATRPIGGRSPAATPIPSRASSPTSMTTAT